MFEFFDFIIETINSIWGFFTGLLDNLILMFKYIGVVAELCYSTIATLPSWLQAFGTLTIVVSVIFIVVGRQGGKSD